MGESARCFQLYWSTDDDVVSSLVARAEATGCRAIIVTLDTTYLGWRPRDLNRGFLPFLDAHGLAQYTTDPVFMRKAMEAPASDATAPLSWKALATALQQARRVPGSSWKNLRSGRARAAVSYFVQSYTRANLRWEDIPRLRDMTHLPIVLKGILRADDARRAIDAGADAIYVSNHGGRQIDGAISSLHALKAIAAAVRGELSIWFDSGIRNGADIVKALALGADLVGIGRPYVYGLALDGAAGVEAVVANLAAELDLTMRLVGARTVADLRNSNMVASHS